MDSRVLRAFLALSTASVVVGVAPLAAAPVLGRPATHLYGNDSDHARAGGLKVMCTGATQTSLLVTWKPVVGVDHYNVIVFDGRTDTVRVVNSSTTSYTYVGSGVCTRYRVRVVADMPDGSSGSSNDYLVGSLAPGGINGVRATRSAPGTAATISWGVPTIGNGAVRNYRVVVTQTATGRVVVDRTSADASERITGLDPARIYVAKVTPTNSYGSCATGTVLLGNQLPTAPGGLQVARSPRNPATVNLTWTAPSGPATAR